MNKLRNKVQLIGNVGDNPEIINLENDKKVARFSIATNEHYKNAKGEKVKRTYWHKVVAWNKVAAIIQKFVVKGKEIAIEGKLTPRVYEDNDGVKHYITEVEISELLLLGKVENKENGDENTL